MPAGSFLRTVAHVSVLGVSVRTFAQGADTPDPTPTEILELRGAIGKGLAVRMHLEVRDVVRRQGSESFAVGEQYAGFYFYEKHGTRIALRGYFNAQGTGGAAEEPEIEIAEDTGGKKTGVFFGRLDEIGFRGEWEAFEPQRELPFRLRVISRRGPEQ